VSEASVNLPEPVVVLTEEAVKARRKRNVALAGSLFLFTALVFVITMVQLYRNVHGHH
jgi:hypothetical protein